MALPHALLAPRRVALLRSIRSGILTSTIATRCITSSRRSAAQVQDDVSQDSPNSSPETLPSEEPLKLGKRARRVLQARQRREEYRIAKEAKSKARAQAQAAENDDIPPFSRNVRLPLGEAPRIVKVKHVLASNGIAIPAPPPIAEPDPNPSSTSSGHESHLTAGWSGSLFRSHISSLLSGFGTAPNTVQLHDGNSPPSLPEEQRSGMEPPSLSTGDEPSDLDREANTSPRKGILSPTAPAMTKTERMESQARVIFQAIREARERGIVDEDESFFYPYPEGVPPKDVNGKDAVWLNLGPDPEAWGREIPPVKDRWLEVLSLGLTKEITGHPFNSPSSPESQEELDEGTEDTFVFEGLVDDYDLEDHERLEQLGDSIVNMSSRLLAYTSYPDVNEGSLTRLSNYPTQNNFLALLFQECGLAARRDELKCELRKARFPGEEDGGEFEETTSQQKKGAEEAHTEEEKARLPLLIKRDADMFEAYAAAVFLSHGNNFNVVHEWLCHLFRPFQDQAYRFMVQRSEALARLQASRAAAAASSASKHGDATRPTNLSADGLGIHSAFMDPSSVTFSSLFPDFILSRDRHSSSARIPAYALHNSPGQAFITDEFLTVAARARRQREERLREELRMQDQQELMNMGWFRKGFLNLRNGFRQYVLGKDVVLEQEARLMRKVDEQRGMSERDRQKLRAKERHAAGVSIRSTGSKKRTKVAEVADEERTS